MSFLEGLTARKIRVLKTCYLDQILPNYFTRHEKSYNFKTFVLNYDLAACTVHTFERYQFSTSSLGMFANSIQKNAK